MKNEKHLLKFEAIKTEGVYFQEDYYEFERVKYYF